MGRNRRNEEKRIERHSPEIGGVLERVGEIFAPWEPFSKARWVGMMWPWMLFAALAGVTFELTKYGVLEVRRRIYNWNRNRKYANETPSLTGGGGGRPSRGGRGESNAKNVAEAGGGQGRTGNGADAGKGVGNGAGRGAGNGAWRGGKGRFPKKNQLWRTTPHGRGRGGYRGSCQELLPLPPDFAENLSKQWDRVRDSSEEAIKFGEMLVELEDYVDNSFIFDGEDRIVGRNSGIKGFLEGRCRHVNYKTAMRYRTLALKAREISREQGKLHEISKDCGTVHELSERLDEALKVEHRRARPGQRRRRRKAARKSPQSAIFSLREQAYSAFEKLDGAQRERLAAALHDLARELMA